MVLENNSAATASRTAHPVDAAIDTHLEASLPHTVAGNYAGTHWLASFALLALTEG